MDREPVPEAIFFKIPSIWKNTTELDFIPANPTCIYLGNVNELLFGASVSERLMDLVEKYLANNNISAFAVVLANGTGFSSRNNMFEQEKDPLLKKRKKIFMANLIHDNLFLLQVLNGINIEKMEKYIENYLTHYRCILFQSPRADKPTPYLEIFNIAKASDNKYLVKSFDVNFPTKDEVAVVANDLIEDKIGILTFPDGTGIVTTTTTLDADIEANQLLSEWYEKLLFEKKTLHKRTVNDGNGHLQIRQEDLVVL